MFSSPAPATPSAGPCLVHGYSAAKKTGRLVAFAALPNQRAVQLCDTATFRPSCSSCDEAYLKVTLEKLAQTVAIKVRLFGVLFASVSLTVLSELFIEVY
jgi:hypothetical protein